jgi:heme exporter protein C
MQNTMSELTQQTWLGRITGLANPTRFVALADRVVPWLAALSALLLAYGLYRSFTAPEDYQQGITVRIMFIHVPFAWLAMMCYSVMTVSAIGSLVWRHPLADVAIRAAAPIGAVFTLLALITGSLWGKPMWGTWWVWDARLTSVFVLFIIYLAIIALARAIDDPVKSARPVAIIVIVGSINLPIIKFSVDWWNTLHQSASISKFGRPSMPPEFYIPLLIMALGFTLLFFTLHIMAMRTEVARRRVVALRRLAARAVGKRASADDA